MIKIAFASFGCKVNRAETDDFIRELGDYGAEKSKLEEADFIIINSCAVTAKAVSDVEKYIRCLKSRYSAQIVLTGCIGELEQQGADIILTNADKVSLLEKIGLNKTEAKGLEASTGTTRAFVKIQDGCDRFCTYCIIPSLRGAPVSVSMKKIEEDVKKYVKAGHKEVVLTGVNTALYEPNLVVLLERLAGLPGDFRLRLTSFYPESITKELITFIKESGSKICPHFHLSVQSGSSETLARMGRNYSAQKVAEAVSLIRLALPEAGIGADFIAGFPGETEEQFEESCRLALELGFDYIHSFPYSQRPGTKAACFDGQLSESEKKKRAAVLRDISKDLKTAAAIKLKGQTLRVLTEKGGKGHADNYFTVKTPGLPPGIFADMRITDFDENLNLEAYRIIMP